MAEVIRMPKLGFDITDGILEHWVIAEGELVEKGQILAEIETDKATVEVEAITSGTVLKHLVAEGAIMPVGTPIVVIGSPDEPVDLQALLQESGIDGSLNLASDGIIEGAVDPSSPPVAPTTEHLPVSKLRATVGRRMAASKKQIPHFYLTAEVDASAFMQLRAELNTTLPEDAKLSINDFIVKAAALASRSYPNLNVTLDDGHIVRHGEINIGVAVAVEDGLLTVVVKNADVKPLSQISTEIRSMVKRTRIGRVRPEDIEGSTFTVSNLGMFDIDHFIAIINPPESALLSIGSVKEIPVVKDGEVVPGLRMQCTLSADHRVTDGAEAARWLQIFRKFLDQPHQLKG